MLSYNPRHAAEAEAQRDALREALEALLWEVDDQVRDGDITLRQVTLDKLEAAGYSVED